MLCQVGKLQRETKTVHALVAELAVTEMSTRACMFLAIDRRIRLLARAFRALRTSSQPEPTTTTSRSLVGKYRPAGGTRRVTQGTAAYAHPPLKSAEQSASPQVHRPL